LAMASYPFPHRLAIDPKRRRNLGHRAPASHRLYHPQSTNRRHWGILVSVHLGPPVMKSDDLAVISFSQLDRGDNVLRHHS
jgi:hypothetical protein